MSFERHELDKDMKSLLEHCMKCQHYHCMMTMEDGSEFDGIIEDADMDGVNVLVGEDVMEPEYGEERQYYFHMHPHMHHRRRFRRFRRRRFPLSALARLSLLEYPYYY